MINTFSLIQLRGRLIRNGQSERGTTLIEMMVVIAIIGILSIGIVYLMTALFNSSILGQQAAAQQSETSTASSFVGSRVNGCTAIGEPDGSNISGVSIAGDQFVCRDDTDCVRAFYVLHSLPTDEGQLRYATAPLSNCDSIKPVRGPNETVDPHSGCPAPCYHAEPGDQNYDPVLDDPEESSVLIDFASLSDGANSITYENEPFTYMDADDHVISWFTPEANSSFGALAPLWASQIRSIRFTIGVRAVSEGTTPAVSARAWTQVAFIG
jgi:prepilin-type N-terminal cleavage/methylation domain-containing protein